MGRVRIISNRLPSVIAALPREVDQAVDETANALATVIRANAWRDTGVALATTKSDTGGSMRSTVGIGVERGRGFYVIFHEFGTRKMGARPVGGPAAHLHEPVLAQKAAEAVRRAAG